MDVEGEEDESPMERKSTSEVNVSEKIRTKKSWENDVAWVETVEKSENDEILVYLVWQNGHRTVNLLTEVEEKAPKKAIYLIIP